MNIDFKKVFSSRTVWVIIVLFLVNGVSGIREFIPEGLLPVIDAVLGLAAVYFRVAAKVVGFTK